VLRAVNGAREQVERIDSGQQRPGDEQRPDPAFGKELFGKQTEKCGQERSANRRADIHQHHGNGEQQGQRTHGRGHAPLESLIDGSHGDEHPTTETGHEVFGAAEHDEQADQEGNEFVGEENNLRSSGGLIVFVPEPTVDHHGQIQRPAGALQADTYGLIGFEIHALREPIDNISDSLAVYFPQNIALENAGAVGRRIFPNGADYGSSRNFRNGDAVGCQAEEQVVGEEGISEDADGSNGHDLPRIVFFRHTSVVRGVARL
jgi:hypothetical protein